jgi:hypothetical protein
MNSKNYNIDANKKQQSCFIYNTKQLRIKVNLYETLPTFLSNKHGQ